MENANKTPKRRGPGRPFTSEYQPSKRGRPKGPTPGTVLRELLDEPYRDGDETGLELGCRGIVKDFVEGDPAARALVFSYTTPKPAQEHNVTADITQRQELPPDDEQIEWARVVLKTKGAGY